MATITIKGREIPLIYTTQEMLTIQKDIAPIGRAMKLFVGANPEDEKDESWYTSAQHLDALAKMIRILGNAGLEEAGENPDLTEKKVLRAIRPLDIPECVNACVQAINEGMESEIPEKEEEGPVDVTLENMKKKDGKAD